MVIDNVKKKKWKFLQFAVFYLPLSVLVMGMTGWAWLAIYFSNLPGQNFRLVVSILMPCFTGLIFWFVRPLWRKLVCFLMLFCLVLCWWLLIPASNDRNWQPDVAVLCHAEINGDDVTIHNIRNCDYRTKEDYTPQYYDKTFSLSKLQTADLYVVTWGPKLIAHTMMSFGFGDQGYVCISIETRKEQGESYSAIKGFFKQFELIYIVADERDLVRLRTNYRGEKVYLYRLKSDPKIIREVFLDYFKQINRLVDNPGWYNALTQNCTTTIRGHTRPYTQKRPFDWRLLANGYLDQMLYDRKVVDTNYPFAELKKRVYINDKAVLLDNDPNFSYCIRVGVPGIEDIKD